MQKAIKKLRVILVQDVDIFLKKAKLKNIALENGNIIQKRRKMNVSVKIPVIVKLKDMST